MLPVIDSIDVVASIEDLETSAVPGVANNVNQDRTTLQRLERVRLCLRLERSDKLHLNGKRFWPIVP